MAQSLRENTMTTDAASSPMEMEIFASGRHTDSAGRARSWTERDLDEIAQEYDPLVHEAPAVLGHPEHDSPAYGWVQSLVRKGKKLVANFTPTSALSDLIRAGLFKKRSAAFYHPHDPHNPKPGKWYGLPPFCGPLEELESGKQIMCVGMPGVRHSGPSPKVLQEHGQAKHLFVS
jgi:hypothetical protein